MLYTLNSYTILYVNYISIALKEWTKDLNGYFSKEDMQVAKSR